MQNLIAGIRQIGAKQSMSKVINQTKSVSELSVSDRDTRKRQASQMLGSEAQHSQLSKVDQVNVGMIVGSGGIQ